MPPPTHRWMVSSTMAKVRMVSARSKSPFAWMTPRAPIDAPRPTGSSAAIWSMAAILGAPVTEPPGNIAASRSGRPRPGRTRPVTLATRGAPRRPSSVGSSAPARRPCPARTRDPCRCAPGRRSSRAPRRPCRTMRSSAVPPSGRVPLMGIVVRVSPRRDRNSSGDADTIAQPSPCISRPWRGRSTSSARPTARGSPANGACRCWTRLTW